MQTEKLEVILVDEHPFDHNRVRALARKGERQFWLTLHHLELCFFYHNDEDAVQHLNDLFKIELSASLCQPFLPSSVPF